MKKAVVFVDGSSFYFCLKELTANFLPLPKLINFLFNNFFKYLTKQDNFELVEARYYLGALKRQKDNKKSDRMYANQQKLLAKLKTQGTEIILGHLIQHPDKTFHEKGVDVRLAVEMIKLARGGKYDRAYLLSSDTDLIPAVEEVRSLGKSVVYVGVKNRKSFGLSKAANHTRLLVSEDVKPFLMLE